MTSYFALPLQFQAGDDVVECEVFENETYGLLNGWDSTSILPGQRLKYSNRKGELSSEEFPEVRSLAQPCTPPHPSSLPPSRHRTASLNLLCPQKQAPLTPLARAV